MDCKITEPRNGKQGIQVPGIVQSSSTEGENDQNRGPAVPDLRQGQKELQAFDSQLLPQQGSRRMGSLSQQVPE